MGRDYIYEKYAKGYLPPDCDETFDANVVNEAMGLVMLSELLMVAPERKREGLLKLLNKRYKRTRGRYEALKPIMDDSSKKLVEEALYITGKVINNQKVERDTLEMLRISLQREYHRLLPC